VLVPVASWRFVMIAAASVGFAFMLMELVWYRMLGPILGGSTFTFGLILVIALLGVGLGGAGYALASSNRRPTVNAFALTCALEALCIALPYALGDRIAMLALVLRPLGALGFDGQILGWAIITLIVVFPAALIAGYQFPMLIALLGAGREDVGRHTGFAYAANTAGAIGGSLVWRIRLLPADGRALESGHSSARRHSRLRLSSGVAAQGRVAFGLAAASRRPLLSRRSRRVAAQRNRRGRAEIARPRSCARRLRTIFWARRLLGS
jgi:hypothetical protein